MGLILTKAILGLDQHRGIVDPRPERVDDSAIAILGETERAADIVEEQAEILGRLPCPDGRRGHTIAVGLEFQRLTQAKAGLAFGHILGVDGFEPHDAAHHTSPIFKRADRAPDHLDLLEKEWIGKELRADTVKLLGTARGAIDLNQHLLIRAEGIVRAKAADRDAGPLHSIAVEQGHRRHRHQQFGHRSGLTVANFLFVDHSRRRGGFGLHRALALSERESAKKALLTGNFLCQTGRAMAEPDAKAGCSQ